MSDSILVVGTGALANLFAARLAAINVAVTMLGTWPEGLAALRQHGVTLVEPGGKQQAYAVNATNDPADCKDAKYALMLVKSWQTERAAKQLSECLAKDGIALTLQNGLGNQELLAAALGSERVAVGVTTTGATLLSSGRVRPGGEGVISIGDHPKLNPMQQMLSKAGFKVELLEDVNALIWGKLVINAAINPITALLGITNGEILAKPSLRKLSAVLAQEVSAVATAREVKLAFSDPVAAAEGVAERTATNNSSMLQDVMRAAPTEIDAICGAVVKAGEAAGVDAPVNRTLWRLVKSLGEP